MPELLGALVAPVLCFTLFAFLIFRLGFFSLPRVDGRAIFVTGGILVFWASFWQVVRVFENYSAWFVTSAYPYIDLAQIGLLGLGLILSTAGLALYADYWQSRREELDSHQNRLAMLDNLQNDAHQPYHLVELVEAALREILINYSSTAGAVLLLNRAQRQFVLTASNGLTRDETSALERYPLGRNVISQAVELSEPVITTHVDLPGQPGRASSFRFNSMMVIPMASGLDRIGALILMSEERSPFDRSDIRYLTPLVQWMAERIRAGRLQRELVSVTAQRDRFDTAFTELGERLKGAAQVLAESQEPSAFCSRLVGLLSCDRVDLVELARSGLRSLGSSGQSSKLGENLSAALVDAMDRSRPLIINQEAETETGAKTVQSSILVLPLGLLDSQAALLLRRSDRAFRVTDSDLKLLDSVSALARVAVVHFRLRGLNISQRVGFDSILALLNPSADFVSFTENPKLLAKSLAPSLPESSSLALMLANKKGDGFEGYPAVAGSSSTEGIKIGFGDGLLGRTATSGQPMFLSGENSLRKMARSEDEPLYPLVTNWSNQLGPSPWVAILPIDSGSGVKALLMVAIADLRPSQETEYERLLTLYTAICGIRLAMYDTVGHPQSDRATDKSRGFERETINQLNNHLSAIVGSAQLATERAPLDLDLRANLITVIEQSEAAARLIKREKSPHKVDQFTEPPRALDDNIRKVLSKSRVSGDLYMAAQRPREIRTRLNQAVEIPFAGKKIRALFESVIDRFASVAEEDDVITIETYSREGYVYLDVSRHGRDFPPVQQVAGFGKYVPADSALKSRPSDIYLGHISDTPGAYAFDQSSSVPAYLSFRFPLKQDKTSDDSGSEPVSLLAIDDQQVILELIQAMGQSLGYEVRTASTGEEGIRIAENHSFDIVLTDLALPGISGLEVASQLRHRYPQMPIILVTGWEANPDRERIRRSGITDVLYKPFRIEQLTDMVKSSLVKTFSE